MAAGRPLNLICSSRERRSIVTTGGTSGCERHKTRRRLPSRDTKDRHGHRGDLSGANDLAQSGPHDRRRDVFLFHESINRQQTQSIERRRPCRYAEPQQRAPVLACNPKGADRRRAVLIVCGRTQRRSALEDARVIVQRGTPQRANHAYESSIAVAFPCQRAGVRGKSSWP